MIFLSETVAPPLSSIFSVRRKREPCESPGKIPKLADPSSSSPNQMGLQQWRTAVSKINP